jgi:hypothetical protein
MLTLVGVAMIVVALRDVVHELFHPERSGSLSRGLMRLVWAAARVAGRRYRRAIHHAGPVMLIAVGAAWAVLLAVGTALIYLPRLPGSFSASPALPPSATKGFMTALYISLGMLTSAGTSDMTPRTPLMRMVAVTEPVFGLVLITAWITWVLSIYPVIAQRRAFTRRVNLIRRSQPRPTALPEETPRDAVATLLESLSGDVARITSQLAQGRVTYYFQHDSPDLSLASTLRYVLDLARAAESRAGEPLLRHYGMALRLAVEALLAEIGEQFLAMKGAEPRAIIAALARDQLLPPVPVRERRAA